MTSVELAERICHKEQLGIWAGEIATALAFSDFLKEDWTFDDTVDLEKEIEAQLLDIIKSALTHPEINATERLQAAEALAQTYAEALRFVHRWAWEKEGNGTSDAERLDVIKHHPGIAALQPPEAPND